MAVKMKIGILNVQDTDWNYGAVLVAAALQYEIEKLGYDAQHIDLRIHKNNLAFLEKLRMFFSKANAKKYIKIILKMYSYPGNRNTPFPLESTRIFEHFRKKWLKRSEKFHSMKSLRAKCWDYNSIVVGSDQVWRYSIIGEKWLEAFFLDFVPKNIKKISYAASFGFDYWEKEKNDECSLKVKKMLQEFSVISVREESGIKICKDVFGVCAKLVLDPVLLAGREFFEKIIASSKIENINAGNIVHYSFSDLAKPLSSIEEILSLKSQSIYFKIKKYKKIYTKVPNFLNGIKNCGFMVTDSFHGTCLAILFERPFVCFCSSDTPNTRLENLFKICRLESCLLNVNNLNENKLKEVVSFAKQIDWMDVNERLKKERDISREFLKNSLEEGINENTAC
jgi:hypothetical protein